MKWQKRLINVHGLKTSPWCSSLWRLSPRMVMEVAVSVVSLWMNQYNNKFRNNIIIKKHSNTTGRCHLPVPSLSHRLATGPQYSIFSYISYLVFTSHSIIAVSEVLPFPEHKQLPFREHGAPAFHTKTTTGQEFPKTLYSRNFHNTLELSRT